MNILIAEDDPISRCMLQGILTEWGHQVVVTTNGEEAWQVLQSAAAPPLAVLDWVMPGLNGVDICRKMREIGSSTYLIMLTGLDDQKNVVAGLEAGADDYITKPFSPSELRARINVGIRMVELHQRLASRVHELETALAHVRQLQGILPICSGCKKIRNDQNYWQEVDRYLTEHSEILFSHGLCPDCFKTAMAEARRELGLVGGEW